MAPAPLVKPNLPSTPGVAAVKPFSAKKGKPAPAPPVPACAAVPNNFAIIEPLPPPAKRGLPAPLPHNPA